MKKCLIVLICILFTTAAFALQSPWVKPLPYKTASVVYKLTGSMPGGGSTSGKMEIYFKDYGNTAVEVTKTTATVMGMTNQENELVITTPDWEYTVDYANNSATKITNPDKYLTQIFNKLSLSDQQKIINIINKRGWGIVESTRATYKRNVKKVLGIMCDKISVTNPEPEMSDEITTTYNIKGTMLPLIVEFRKGSMASVNMTATSFKKSAPNSKFTIPNIDFDYDREEDANNLQDARETINRLLGMGGKPPKKAIQQQPKPQKKPEVHFYRLSSAQLQMLMLLLMEAVDMPQVSESQQQYMTLMMQKIHTNEISGQEQYQTLKLLDHLPLDTAQRQQLQDIKNMF